MEKKPVFSSAIILIGVLAIAISMSAMNAIVPVTRASGDNAYQGTVAPTLPINLTPPVVIVTTTAGVTTDVAPAPQNGFWLFLGILVIAGFAFLIAIFALMRRPHQ